MRNDGESFLERVKNNLSKLSLKTILYTIGALAVIILIIISAKSGSKYGEVGADGKFYLDLNKVAKDYNIDLTSSDSIPTSADYEDGNRNITNDLDQSLLITTLYLNQNGITDPTIGGKILANIISDYQAMAQGKVYTESDLDIIRGTDQNALQDYYTSIDDALANYEQNLQKLNPLPVNIDTNISTSTETEDEVDQNIIDIKGVISANVLQMIDLNNDLINTLISIPATEEGATYQLAIINLISNENNYLQAVAYIDSDPAKYLLIGGDDFQDNFSTNLETAITNFRNYFQTNGVNFNS